MNDQNQFKVGDVVVSKSGSFARVLDVKKGLYICTVWCRSFEEASTTDKNPSVFNQSVAVQEGIKVFGAKKATAEDKAPTTKPVAPKKEDKAPVVDTKDIANEEVATAEYKLIADVQTTDENGVAGELLLAGSVQELPVVLGDIYVTEGIAEKVEGK